MPFIYVLHGNPSGVIREVDQVVQEIELQFGTSRLATSDEIEEYKNKLEQKDSVVEQESIAPSLADNANEEVSETDETTVSSESTETVDEEESHDDNESSTVGSIGDEAANPPVVVPNNSSTGKEAKSRRNRR